MMYEQWEQDPSSVHASWHAYFSGLDNDGNSSFELPPSIGQSSYEKKLEQISELLAGGAKAEVGAPTGSVRTSVETANVYRLIRAHQTHGHLMADVDPIGLAKAYENDPELTAKFRYPSENMRSVLDYKTYGFTEADLDKTYYIDLAHSGAILSKRKDWKLRDLIEAYQNATARKSELSSCTSTTVKNSNGLETNSKIFNMSPCQNPKESICSQDSTGPTSSKNGSPANSTLTRDLVLKDVNLLSLVLNSW